MAALPSIDGALWSTPQGMADAHVASSAPVHSDCVLVTTRVFVQNDLNVDANARKVACRATMKGHCRRILFAGGLG